ncbi:hypothetical protein F8388_022792 [Cannabis sativa]|uniref:Uncharacterized protein n=1 Tax=Cannabis sativa TaxID=3483 RepID=A0A7J6FE45_CANSA|nr:hypothetical protein F8388_022792 [Cannabis sativa]
MESGGKAREEEQDGMSVHSPCKAPPSSASSLPKEQSQVELELRLLEALEIYPPIKLQGMPLLIFVTKLLLQFLLFFGQTSIHRHFVLFGLMEFLRRSFNRQFSSDEVLQLLDRFYNLEVLKPDDEDIEVLNREEDFSLPQSFFVKEES